VQTKSWLIISRQKGISERLQAFLQNWIISLLMTSSWHSWELLHKKYLILKDNCSASRCFQNWLIPPVNSVLFPECSHDAHDLHFEVYEACWRSYKPASERAKIAAKRQSRETFDSRRKHLFAALTPLLFFVLLGSWHLSQLWSV